MNYEPNSFNGPEEAREFREHGSQLSGVTNRFDHRENNDDYTQVGNLFRLMKEDERGRLIDNLVDAIGSVEPRIQYRQVVHFFKADTQYGSRVAEGLKRDIKELERLAVMSLHELKNATTIGHYSDPI